MVPLTTFDSFYLWFPWSIIKDLCVCQERGQREVALGKQKRKLLPHGSPSESGLSPALGIQSLSSGIGGLLCLGQ